MKLKNYISLSIIFLLCCGARAQDDRSPTEAPARFRVFGLNSTPLLTQLIPFNRSNPRVTGPYHVTFRYYKRTRKGNYNGFRWALGVDLSDVEDEGIQSFFNFRIGWEKQRRLHPKWNFSSGADIMLVGGDLNIPGDKETDAGALGLGPVWGIEYNVSPQFSLSIETALFLGVQFDFFSSIKFEFIPPVALYANYKIPGKLRK